VRTILRSTAAAYGYILTIAATLAELTTTLLLLGLLR
jgi:hypothetical protein